MADSATTSSDAAAQRAAEQARLRKERREAKLKAGGSARLNKITGMSGRPEEDISPAAPSPAASASVPDATTAPPPPQPAEKDGDPDEVDISQHFFQPTRTPRPGAAGVGPDPQISDAALRNMMLGYDPSSTVPPQAMGPNPMAGMPPGAEDDPMMKMLSQMMGGAGLPGMDGASPFPGMPPMPGQQQAAQPVDRYTALWRLLHAIVAISLGLYIVVLTPFTGTKIERDQDALSDAENVHRKDLFFWTFATAEACLLTTRLYLDKRRAPPAGVVRMVVGYLPEPYKGYVETLLWYGQMLSTVRADILACMFVLGVCAWWRA